MPKTITLTGLAQHLGVSRPTVYKMLKSKDFPQPIPQPPQHNKRWNIEDVDAWRFRNTKSDTDK